MSMDPEEKERSERFDRQMEFLAKSMASHDAQIAENARQIAEHSAQIRQLVDVTASMFRIVEEQGRRMEESQHLTDERFRLLADSQRHTDERLSSLINVVERYFSNGRN